VRQGPIPLGPIFTGSQFELKGYACGSVYIARQRGEDEATFKARAQALTGQSAALVILKEDR
jgi:hypothetical protein